MVRIGENMVKYTIDDLFGEVNGILIDDSYDNYKLKMYLRYCKSQKVNYIVSQDHDLSYLDKFLDIEYLSLPIEAHSFENLYKLYQLKGIKLYANSLESLDLRRFKSLKYLSIDGYNSKIRLNIPHTVEHICLMNFNYTDIRSIDLPKQLRTLKIDSFAKLKSIEGIYHLDNLTSLEISECSKLEDINDILSVKQNLNELIMINNAKLNVYEWLSEMTKLNKLVITKENKTKIQTISTISFFNNLPIKYFVGSLKIIDGDLRPLLKLDHAELDIMYKFYNLTDMDLPKIHVQYKVDNFQIKVVPLSSLPLGRNDPNIIWND